MQQQTIKESFKLSGIGLHTGKKVTLTFFPAPVNTGYRVKRSDLPDQPEVLVNPEMVKSTQRATLLERGNFSVSTIEHAFSALYALGIDNCLMSVDAPEFPILDGSGQSYVEHIKKVGVETQKADKKVFVVKKNFEVQDEETGARLLLIPDDKFSVEAHVDFDSPYLKNQSFTFSINDDYSKEIANARSFVFLREIEPLLATGLIKGGDLSNALLINDAPLSSSQLQLFESVVKEKNISLEPGYINPSAEFGLSEPARHKILDIIGDLALVGNYIQGRVIAFHPGHGINNRLARLLYKEIKKTEMQSPYYDPNQEPLMDVLRIRELLPHRYPFLLVDKVVELTENCIVGVKNVSGNESFFLGHFPQEPVMPGVLILEAMAQTGGLLVLNLVMKENESWSTYFLKIDNVKFRQKVVPGDTLLFKLRLLSEIRRGIVNMRGLAFVGETLVCEADFTAQIVKN